MPLISPMITFSAAASDANSRCIATSASAAAQARSGSSAPPPSLGAGRSCCRRWRRHCSSPMLRITPARRAATRSAATAARLLARAEPPLAVGRTTTYRRAGSGHATGRSRASAADKGPGDGPMSSVTYKGAVYPWQCDPPPTKSDAKRILMELTFARRDYMFGPYAARPWLSRWRLRSRQE